MTVPTETMIGLRPDIVIKSGETLKLVADTKWKRVGVSSRGYLEPETADVHQMFAYAAAFGCDQLALIYPSHAGLRNARETTLRLPSAGGVSPQLHVVVLDVERDGLPVRFGAMAGTMKVVFGENSNV